MEYKKITKDNYNLHIINTDKFKTVNVLFNFKRKIEKNEIAIRNLLNDILINSCSKYKTSREIEIQTQELYDLGISSRPYKSGNYHIISYKVTFLNEKYTEKNMTLQSLEFMLDLIFKPNIINSGFNKEYYDILKNSIVEDINGLQDNPKKYSVTRLYENMDDGPLSYRSCGYLKDLKNLNEQKLYEYYQDVINNDIIDIFIIGDIKEDYTKLFDKYIPNNKRINNELSHFLDLKIDKEKELKETIKNNQSNLSIGLKTENLTDFELKYVMSLYSLILGGNPNSKLFQNVREKNSLCYHISSSPAIISKIITIVAGINKENYEKTVKLIKKELDNMEKGNIEDQEIEEAKKIYIAGCNQVYDSPMSIINNYLSNEYTGLELVEERIKNVKKVTKEDIVNFAKKIHIDTIFLLEGDLDNGKEEI